MSQIPNSITSQHVAVLGKTGSGKTSTAKLLVEQVVAEGARVCVLDPIKSDWWGMTSSADGRRPGLPFHILGGPRGHVPLHSSAGKAIAEIVANGALPLSIVDMADFEPGGQAKFFVDFAPTLLRKMRGVVYLVIEEAHLFAPKERSGIGAENLSIHWAKTLATAGRSKGVRLVVVTQRTQALHNALLGSCDTLIAHRLTAPADQEPVLKWLKANTTKEVLERVSSELASLKTGDAWICSGEARIFTSVHFGRISTYDNTATPTGDGDTREVKTAAVDQEKLRAIIGDAVEQAKADDPKELRKRIAELERQVSSTKIGLAPGVKSVSPKVVEKPVITDAQLARLEKQVAAMTAALDRAASIFAKPLGPLAESCQRLASAVNLVRRPAPSHAHVNNSTGARSPVQPRGGSAPRPRGDASDSKLPPGEKATLIAAAQYPDGLTREQASILTGYKRSSRDAYIQRLVGRGYVEVASNLVVATEAGVAALGEAFEPLPTGEALRSYWLNRLPPGEKAVLEIAIEHYPHDVLRERIDQSTGYKRSSRDAYIQRLISRRLLSAGRGTVRATEVLFE
jgi:hypothetical protein